MGKKLGSILVLIVAGALMLYSASRTMHLLAATLPPGQEILGVIALAAFDLGLVAWLIVFLKGAEGGLQRGIALLMVVIDLVGVVVGFLGDTLLTAGQTGLLAKLAEGDKQTIVMLTAGVIAANIAGAVFYHLCSPDNLRRMAEESAKDKIQSQALAAINQQANLLAEQLAPIIADDWVRQMQAEFMAALTDHTTEIKKLPPAKVEVKPSRLEKIKARLAAPAAAPMSTMASEGEALEADPEPAKRGRGRPKKS